MSKKGQTPTQAKTLVTDDRFKHVHSDPRFKRSVKNTQKAKIDKRFQSALTDKDFATDVVVDKYGRKIKTKGVKEMYDDAEEDESEEPVPKKENKKQAKAAPKAKQVVEEEEEEEEEEDEDVQDEEEESTDIGSTDDEELDGDSDEEELNDGYIPGSIANTAAPVVEKPTHRLAMMNMEWEQLRAVDLLAVMRSFCPANGQVHSVAIYPSEFGKQRMAEEAKFGPVALFESSKDKEKSSVKQAEEEDEGEELVFEEIEDEDEDADEDVEEDEEDAEVAAAMRRDAEEDDIEVDEDVEAEDEDLIDESDIDMDEMVQSDDENGDGIDMDKLREYELSKLRYYYAIVDCDSPETALHIYKEADGLEYETSANVFDLRFVPDEQVFDESTLKDKATKVPANHRPPVYQTNALQQTKVKCTWDREDPARAKLLRRQFEPGTYKADDLSVFMADESDEEGYGTDVPVSESDDSESEDEEAEDGRVIRDEDGKKKVLLKRRARSAFASILNEIKGGDSKDAKKKKEMAKKVAKANKAHNGEEDEDEESEESSDSDSDSDDQEIVFQPALHTFADRVANKAKEKEEEAVKARMTLWEKHLAKLKDKKKAKKTEAKVKAKQEAITKGKIEKGSIYSDDEVDYDKSDPFFQNVFDEEEFGADAAQETKGKGKKTKKAVDSDEEEEEEVIVEKKTKTGKDKTVKSKEQAELELLMMKDQREEEEEKRGYSLSTLVKENKLKHKAESKKRKTRANEEDALIDSMLGKQVQDEVTAEDMIRTAKKKYGQKKKVEETVAAMTTDTFKMDVSDDRFAALHADPAFAIDPTSQLFKATAGTEALLQETQRKRRDLVREQEKQIRERKAKLRTTAQDKVEEKEEKSEKQELQSLVAKLKTANTMHNMQEKVKETKSVQPKDVKGKGKNKK